MTNLITHSNLLRTYTIKDSSIIVYVRKCIIALLPCLPHLINHQSFYGPIMPLLCYGPFILYLCRLEPKQAFGLGALHGLFLVIFASGWVWTYPDLSLIVALLASFISALVLGASCFAAVSVASLTKKHAFVRIFIASAVFVFCEYLRSFSHHLFLPLGSMGQGAAYPVFLPMADWLGATGYSFVFLTLSAAIYTSIAPGLVGFEQEKKNRKMALIYILSVIFVIAAGHIDNRHAEQTTLKLLGNEVLCAASDNERRSRAHNGYFDSHQINQIVSSGMEDFDCSLFIFPEYTSLASRKSLDDHKHQKDTRPFVIAGVMLGEKVENRQLITPDHVTNSTCILELTGDFPYCLDKSDKRYLAPFVESTLFHDLPVMRQFGSWLTQSLMGDTNLARIEQHQQTLSIPGFGKLGVITCLELFIPGLSSSFDDKVSEPIKLIIAPTDLSAFGESKIILSQYQRAAALQAATAEVPLLFVSTEAVELYSSAGKAISAQAHMQQISAWFFLQKNLNI
jgi:apolipoprotein N-acyltransferase